MHKIRGGYQNGRASCNYNRHKLASLHTRDESWRRKGTSAYSELSITVPYFFFEMKGRRKVSQTRRFYYVCLLFFPPCREERARTTSNKSPTQSTEDDEIYNGKDSDSLASFTAQWMAQDIGLQDSLNNASKRPVSSSTY
jgi:hypothetical protein